MNEWVQKQIEGGFADFKGLFITAHIPVKDRLANELLAETLRSAATDSPVPSTSSAATRVDVRSFLKFVEKAELKSTEGAIVLDVVIRI